MFKKSIISILFLFVTSVAYAGETVITKISGMVCPMCAHNIEKSFKAHLKDKTIKSFDVDLDNKVVTFEFSDGKSLTDDQITTGIKDAGYIVKGIERKKP